MSNSDTSNTTIGENINISVSSIEIQPTAVESIVKSPPPIETVLSDKTITPPISMDRQDGKATDIKPFVNTMLQIRKEEKERIQEKEQEKKITLPTFDITLEEKDGFLQGLTSIFRTQLNLKDISKTVKHPTKILYKRLQDILSDMIAYETAQKCISLSSITSIDVVSFSDITSEEQKLKEKQELKKNKQDQINKNREKIKSKFDKKLSENISNLEKEINVLNKEIQKIKDNIAKSKNKRLSFDIIIDHLKRNEGLRDFNKLLKETTQKRLLYKNILYMLIYRPSDDDIEKLKTALLLTARGGKRRTKKIKIKSKKTRSIKKSKKNITRRR